MRTLSVFNSVTVDGRFTDENGDMSWAHKAREDKEWNEFVSGNAKGGGVLVFGRITYQMMASYWPTPVAARNDPVVAERMNSGQKVVFSRTLESVSWKNTTLIKDDMIAAVRRMKAESGPNMVILGSGSIVAQLAQAGLVDQFQLVVNPIALGNGRTMFDGITRKLTLRLAESRAFGNGNVLLTYEPTA